MKILTCAPTHTHSHTETIDSCNASENPLALAVHSRYVPFVRPFACTSLLQVTGVRWAFVLCAIFCALCAAGCQHLLNKLRRDAQCPIIIVHVMHSRRMSISLCIHSYTSTRNDRLALAWHFLFLWKLISFSHSRTNMVCNFRRKRSKSNVRFILVTHNYHFCAARSFVVHSALLASPFALRQCSDGDDDNDDVYCNYGCTYIYDVVGSWHCLSGITCRSPRHMTTAVSVCGGVGVIWSTQNEREAFSPFTNAIFIAFDDVLNSTSEPPPYLLVLHLRFSLPLFTRFHNVGYTYSSPELITVCVPFCKLTWNKISLL